MTKTKILPDIDLYYVGGPLPLAIIIVRVLTNPFMDLVFNRQSILIKWRWVLGCNYLGPVALWATLEAWYIVSLLFSATNGENTDHKIKFVDSFTSTFYLLVLCAIHTLSFMLVVKIIGIMNKLSHLYNCNQRYRQALVHHGIPHLATAAQDLVLLSLIMNMTTALNGVRPILITLIISIESLAFAFERALSYLGKSCSVLAMIGTTGMRSTQNKVIPIHPAMVDHYRNNLNIIMDLLSEWINACGLSSVGIEYERLTKRQVKSHLVKLFKMRTDVFVIVYVGMSSTVDGSWIFKDGTLSITQILSIMNELSPASQLCIVLDSPATESVLAQVRYLDERVIIQTKRSDINLEHGNETNGKFLIEWLKWNALNRQQGSKVWTSSIKPVYATSSNFTNSQRIITDSEFCKYYGAFNCALTVVYKLIHYLPRSLGITDCISLPLKLFNFVQLRLFPPNILYSGFGFYFIKRS